MSMVTSAPAAAPPARRRLSATALAQYVRFGNCDRLLSFILHPERAAALEARWRISPQPLTPLLHPTGEDVERRVVAGIRAAGETVVDLAHRGPPATLAALRQGAAGRRLVLTQTPLMGELGGASEGQAGPPDGPPDGRSDGWPCGGTADLIWLLPGPSGLRATVADVKASLNERVEHRLQVAFYVRLLRQMAARAGIPLVAVDGAVLHREVDAPGAGPTPSGWPITPEAFPPFDLAPYD